MNVYEWLISVCSSDFSCRGRHTCGALVTRVQTCAHPILGDVGREHACQRRSPGSETHPIPLAEQPECPRMTYLESGWQFGSHHFFTVESATKIGRAHV